LPQKRFNTMSQDWAWGTQAVELFFVPRSPGMCLYAGEKTQGMPGGIVAFHRAEMTTTAGSQNVK